MSIEPVSPKAWNIGNTPRKTSPSVSPARSITARALLSRLVCVSGTPFGLPEVPEV